MFLSSFVQLVPADTFWAACCNPASPVVNVDIVLPVRWRDDALEQVYLELDVPRTAAGKVWVRARDKFEQVRKEWPMPDDIVSQPEETCERVRELVGRGTEPVIVHGG